MGGYRKALRHGTRVEAKEHRLGYKLSRKIAKDHLKEGTNYYRHLSKMEKNLHKKKKTRMNITRWLSG